MSVNGHYNHSLKEDWALSCSQQSWQLLLVGGSPTLRQKNGGRKEDEKVAGPDQIYAPTHYRKWKVSAADTSRFWKCSDKAKRNWSSSPTNAQPCGNLK